MVAVTDHIVLTRSKPSLTFRTLVTPDIHIVKGRIAEARWLDGGRVFALALTRVNLGLSADDTAVALEFALPRAVLADEVIPVVDEHTVVVLVGVGDDTLVAYGAVVVGVVDSRHRGSVGLLVGCLLFGLSEKDNE
jgi:hypothetical protein